MRKVIWVLVAAMMLPIAITGCLSSHDTPADDDPSSDDPTDGDSGVSPPTTDTPTLPGSDEPLWSQPWLMHGCTRASGALYEAMPGVASFLPEPYETGDPRADLLLNSAACEGLTIGNDTLIEPFQVAIIYTFVEPTNESSDRREAYVFETIVSDATIQAAMLDYGWPAALGAVVIEEGPSGTVKISAPGLTYEATNVHIGGFPQPLINNEFLLHSGPPGESNLLFDTYVKMDESVLDPGSLTISGGFLSALFPTESAVWTAGLSSVEIRFEFLPVSSEG